MGWADRHSDEVSRLLCRTMARRGFFGELGLGFWGRLGQRRKTTRPTIFTRRRVQIQLTISIQSRRTGFTKSKEETWQNGFKLPAAFFYKSIEAWFMYDAFLRPVTMIKVWLKYDWRRIGVFDMAWRTHRTNVTTRCHSHEHKTSCGNDMGFFVFRLQWYIKSIAVPS